MLITADDEPGSVLVTSAATAFVVIEDADVLVVDQADDVQLAVERGDVQVVIEPSPATVATGSDDAFIVSAGEQGPPGASGLSAATLLQVIAGVALGGDRLVGPNDVGTYVYVDSASADDAYRLAGMTTGAAAAGAPVTVQTHGVRVEPSWAWTPDRPLYLGHNGLPTQVVPTGADAAFINAIGIALSSTTIHLRIADPLFF